MPNLRSFKTHQEYLDYYRKYREENRSEIRKSNREYMARWRKENGMLNKYPEKEVARRKTRYAILSGELKKGRCLVCKNKKAEAHHENYKKPLEVIWLCRLHHNQYHRGIIELSPTVLNQVLTRKYTSVIL